MSRFFALAKCNETYAMEYHKKIINNPLHNYDSLSLYSVAWKYSGLLDCSE